VARRLKRRVANDLHEQLSGTTSTDSPTADPDSLRQRGRALIDESVARWSDDYSRTHGIAPTHDEDRALAEAVYDLLFRAGRLQPYLDDPDIENIVINGCDSVWISRADEPLQPVPPIADSDTELIELLQDLARRHGGGERMLSTAHPTLALRLEGGMRLQAMIAVTPRPYVAIRRHRVASATLGDMVRLGSIDSTLASFLAAAIRARKNVMITGTQGVGKTSLLRAMAAEIPAHERIGTLETEYELWLHELGRSQQIVPMEAREGNGERVDGRAAGEISIGDLIPHALRMTLTRIIVGEVRSSEVVPMLRVMTNGEGGSMCTLHARAPHMIIDRIAELCLEYGPRMTDALAYRLTANALDFVVHLEMVDETALGGRRHRFVSHVLEMTGLGEHGRPAMNTVFAPRPEAAEARAVPHTPPACLDDLRRAGFDPRLLDSPGGTWQGPLGLMVMAAATPPPDPGRNGYGRGTGNTGTNTNTSPNTNGYARHLPPAASTNSPSGGAP
jgi:Flp pilus assembly CpaF family ATPase